MLANVSGRQVWFSANVLRKSTVAEQSRASENLQQEQPRGSKYPTFEVSGSKYHTQNGFWDQRPQTVGICSLWATQEDDVSSWVPPSRSLRPSEVRDVSVGTRFESGARNSISGCDQRRWVGMCQVFLLEKPFILQRGEGFRYVVACM